MNHESRVLSGDTVESKPREVSFDKGSHWRAKLGFILLSTDLVGEDNIFCLLPEGVGASFTRLRTSNDTNVANLAAPIDGMAEAASILQPDARPNVICYVCTSGSIVIGEDTVMTEIKRGAPWAQPTTLVTGVVNGLRRLQAHRIVVATPYLDEINIVVAKFLRQKGFEVLDIQGLNIEDGEAMGRITPSYLRDFVLSIDRDDADVIFVSCGGIRTLDVLQEIEDIAGKPVVCSLQGMMWDCLRRAGIDDAIEGYGQLFQLDHI